MQEEIKGVRAYGSLMLLRFRDALSAVNLKERTEYATAAVIITADRLLL